MLVGVEENLILTEMNISKLQPFLSKTAPKEQITALSISALLVSIILMKRDTMGEETLSEWPNIWTYNFTLQ